MQIFRIVVKQVCAARTDTRELLALHSLAEALATADRLQGEFDADDETARVYVLDGDGVAIHAGLARRRTTA